MAGKQHVQEVPGNSLQEQANMDAFVLRMGVAWLDMCRAIGSLAKQGIVVYRITLKGDLVSGEDVLVVLAAEGQGGKVVAFHSADDMTTVWKGLAARIQKGKLKWKEDEYG